ENGVARDPEQGARARNSERSQRRARRGGPGFGPHQNLPVASNDPPPLTYPGVSATDGPLADGAVRKRTTPAPTRTIPAIPVMVATLPAERASSSALTPR